MNNVKNEVKMMTIREAAKTGILPEHAIRVMIKQKQLPALFIGRKALINYSYLVTYLDNLKNNVTSVE